MRRLRGALLYYGAALFVAGRGAGGGAMTSAPQGPDSLRFVVIAPRAVRLGQPVTLTLRVTNAGRRRVDLYLTGRTITFDIIVARADGQVVWRRLAGTSGQQILQVKALAPGEILELKDVWNQQTNTGNAAEPGEYTVEGVLPTDAAPLRTTPAHLRIKS